MYDLKIGIIESIDSILNEGLTRLDKVGIKEVQLSCWNVSLCNEKNAKKIKEMFSGEYSISGLWGGWIEGPTVWNFIEGPDTIGIVPKTWRKKRVEGLKKVIDFANMLNVKTVTTHMGFMPENPSSELYKEVLDTIFELCEYANQYGIYFCFETGQETPTTILRTIQDVQKRGLDNLRINLDPANLLLYGKGNPSDAVDVFGKYVVGMHVKDGDYPTNGDNLGQEYKVGTGRVDFEYIIKKLHSFNYNGPLTIEREISGDQQIKDIIDTISYLKNILKTID
ncbi:MAG: sugar phosphate isomerase/epimerase [Erysipelotrichaceae bacterium]|nr:sugar phosphate isomerase/epimerase [Erysipelotrichaceae bacterium]